jgi:hypothetical protein
MDTNGRNEGGDKEVTEARRVEQMDQIGNLAPIQLNIRGATGAANKIYTGDETEDR